MAISFPNNPSLNDTFTSGGITFTWNGTNWVSSKDSNILADTTPQLGGNLDVNGRDITGTGNINVTGTVTATSFSGDGSALTGAGTTTTAEWTLGADGSNHYTFTGPGVTAGATDPTIYLTRGQTYKFKNRSGGHPFRIQTSFQNTSGTAYNDGIVNNAAGNGTDLYWEVRNDTPDTLYYQCTSHTNMSGRINMISGENKSIGLGTQSSAGRDAGISTSTGSLIYIPDTGIQIWTGYSWKTIESTSATSYTMTQDQTARNEGETVTFTVNTTGLSNGYQLYWTTKTVSGTINASDFSDNATQGTATVNSSGQATIARTISSDASTEGTESFTIEIRDGGYSSAVVVEGQTVTIADTSLNPTYSGLVQGAYGSSSINGLSWSASTPNDGGGVSSLAIPTNRKTYIEIYWSSNGGGNPGPGVHSGQNTELGLGSNKVWWRGGSQNGLEENGLGSWTTVSGSTSFSTGQYLGIGMDNTANSGNGKITFYRNGTAVFEGGSGWTSRTNLYFHWQNNGSGTSAGTFNFGATAFQYPLSGYGGLYS
tara:strand:+ start:956 stop:2575 length:1620 start_codon:yes stop_codon:yes gene_type:complete